MSTRFAVTISADFLANLLRDGAVTPASIVAGGLPVDAKLERIEYGLKASLMRAVFTSQSAGPASGFDSEVIQELSPVFTSNGGVRVSPAAIVSSGPVISSDPDARAAQEIEQLRAAGKLPPAPTAEEMMKRVADAEAKANPKKDKPGANPAVRPLVPGVVVEEPQAPKIVELPPEEGAAGVPAVVPDGPAPIAPAAVEALKFASEADQLAAETGLDAAEIAENNAPVKNKGGRPKKVLTDQAQ